LNRFPDLAEAGLGLPSAPSEVTARTRAELEDTVFIACGLAWCASLIHVQAAVEHLNEYALYAVFFALLAPLQFAWGVAVYRRPARILLRAGAVMSLLVAGLWLMSRTTGLPIGPEPWRPESVGAADSIATADELVMALLAFFPYGLGKNGVLRRRSRQAAAVAGLGLILLSSLSLVVVGHAP
jgi:hypothetical protein